jgi:hypothetical protein
LNSIKVILNKPESIEELNKSYTSALVKILSDKIPNNSIDNYAKLIETIYADEVSVSERNIMKGEKNEYGCDLYKEV